MSTIGPTSVGATNLAGSLAGAQRNSGDGDRVKEAAGERKTQADLKDLSSKTLNGIGETGESGDRDADGRTPYDFDDLGEDLTSDEAESSQSAQSRKHPRPLDADGDRGVNLDLEA